MFEYLHPSSLIAEILMSKSIPGKTFLAVEGMLDAKKLTAFKSANAIICYLKGKKALNNLYTLSKEEHISNLLIIIDADCTRLGFSDFPEDETVFITDYHDFEMMMIHSEAFENFLYEYCDHKKGFDACKIREEILQTIKPIGILKFLSLKNNWELTLRDIDFKKHLKQDYKSLDVRELLSSIKGNEVFNAISREAIAEEVDKEINTVYELKQLCRGHDFTAVLGIRMAKQLKCQTYEENEFLGKKSPIEAKLRMAYSYGMFKETQLYKDIQHWENSHGKKVFESSLQVK